MNREKYKKYIIKYPIIYRIFKKIFGKPLRYIADTYEKLSNTYPAFIQKALESFCLT